MSGILNKKQRFVDTVITDEGRRQLASGEFKIEFATFSDSEAFYRADLASGTFDMQQLLMLEAPSAHPTDVITMEADPFGNVSAYDLPSITTGSLLNGRFVSYSGANLENRTILSGSNFDSLITNVISEGFQNFNRLQTIGTTDQVLEDLNLTLDRERIDFEINDGNVDRIFSSQEPIRVEKAESHYQDRRLSHLANFQYLPPRNKPTPGDPEGSLMFPYPNNQQTPITTFDELSRELKYLPSEEINFINTSRSNNIVMQLLDVNNNFLSRLSVVDFGEFTTDDPERPIKRVYFVGKNYPMDENGSQTFINLFTMVID
tara:strand:+ start:2684 stop:3637 length:954 start_codon:yes stop_codon:yes gene_type:complete